MHSDLDAILAEHALDALLVIGPGMNNPPMVYLMGGAHLTSAYLLKKVGQPALLFYRSMERDEAAHAATCIPGMQVVDMETTYDTQQLLQKFQVDYLGINAARLTQILSDHGLASGRVAVCGQGDVGAWYVTLLTLHSLLPTLEIVSEPGDALLQAVMVTKSNPEIERIRCVGQKTVKVVGQVAEWLSSQKAQQGVLVQADGNPWTVGDAQRRIRLWLAEQNLETPQGFIFAIGYDAGVPHSLGNSADLMRLGQTIVFDIYPCEAGGGYFYDFTRTWCLGYAPDEALALYEDVHYVYQQVCSQLSVGKPTAFYQKLACDLFQQRGHPTLRDHPATEDGFVHGLGHGVGLYLHQTPFFRLTGPCDECLLENTILTVEPGLYYPTRGLGVRLEDTHWIRSDAPIQPLVDYPLDLVLPVK